MLQTIPVIENEAFRVFLTASAEVTIGYWQELDPSPWMSHSCPPGSVFTAKTRQKANARRERRKQKLHHCSNAHYLHFLAPNNAWQCAATTGAFMERGRIELRPLWEVAEERRQSGMRRTIFIVASFSHSAMKDTGEESSGPLPAAEQSHPYATTTPPIQAH